MVIVLSMHVHSLGLVDLRGHSFANIRNIGYQIKSNLFVATFLEWSGDCWTGPACLWHHEGKFYGESLSAKTKLAKKQFNTTWTGKNEIHRNVDYIQGKPANKNLKIKNLLASNFVIYIPYKQEPI